jgi:hypothetical protein
VDGRAIQHETRELFLTRCTHGCDEIGA